MASVKEGEIVHANSEVPCTLRLVFTDKIAFPLCHQESKAPNSETLQLYCLNVLGSFVWAPQRELCALFPYTISLARVIAIAQATAYVDLLVVD